MGSLPTTRCARREHPREHLSDRVQKGGAIFDIEKLKWFNKEHMKLESDEQKISNLKNIIENSEQFKIKKWDISREILQKNFHLLTPN